MHKSLMTIKLPVLNLFTDCSLMELWNRPAANASILPDVSLLNDSAQYPSCINGSVGSVVLKNTTLNTATVAYYSGTTAGSAACFVCDERSGYTANTSYRVCQRNGLWSGNFIICGKLWYLCYKVCNRLTIFRVVAI